MQTLEPWTDRLPLRTPQIEDADAIQSIVADPRVALTIASIPHPYPEGGAKSFILHVRKSRDRRNLAIIQDGQSEATPITSHNTYSVRAPTKRRLRRSRPASCLI